MVREGVQWLLVFAICAVMVGAAYLFPDRATLAVVGVALLTAYFAGARFLRRRFTK